MKTLIEDLKKVMNSEIEDKDKYMQMLINGFLRERDTELLKLYGVVFNEAETINKQTQAKHIEDIMQADEELGLYSEVVLVCNRINDNNANRCITCGVKAGHPCGLQTN